MHLSDEYLQLQRNFHALRPDYGTSGSRYGAHVAHLCNAFALKTVLDYGCGKGTLARGLQGVAITEYDPAVPGKHYVEGVLWDREPAVPAKYDLVVCTDVLEHIEPEHLDATLRTLVGLTGKLCFLAVHCGPAVKTLPDGRNAHLIQMPPRWWIDKLWEAGFDLQHFEVAPNGFVATLKRYGE